MRTEWPCCDNCGAIALAGFLSWAAPRPICGIPFVGRAVFHARAGALAHRLDIAVFCLNVTWICKRRNQKQQESGNGDSRMYHDQPLWQRDQFPVVVEIQHGATAGGDQK